MKFEITVCGKVSQKVLKMFEAFLDFLTGILVEAGVDPRNIVSGVALVEEEVENVQE